MLILNNKHNNTTISNQINNNDTSHLRTEQVNYIIGSGQHTNSHLYEVNNYLFLQKFS